MAQTSESMKASAMAISVGRMMKIDNCSEVCGLGRKCIRKMSWGSISDLKLFLWGQPDAAAPKPAARLRKYNEIFNIYQAQRAQENSKNLTFKLDGQRICEATFLVLLGLIIPNAVASDVNSQWRSVKKAYLKRTAPTLLNGPNIVEMIDNLEEFRDPNLPRYKSKREHAIGWISNLCNAMNADTIVTMEGSDKKLVIPFDNLKSLHMEYLGSVEMHGEMTSKVATSYGTFKKAFDSFDQKAKLLGCKGSFPTCDICNKANDLLRNANKKLDLPIHHFE